MATTSYSSASATQYLLQAFDIEPNTCLKVSAKTGLGLESVLPAVIEQVPPPIGDPTGPLRMLLFDAFHDEYRCEPHAIISPPCSHLM